MTANMETSAVAKPFYTTSSTKDPADNQTNHRGHPREDSSAETTG